MRTPPLRRRTDHEPADPAPLRALVVDDNDAYRAYVATLVSRFGFEVTSCIDGADAADVMREETFDLLIIDCEMPRLGGLELIPRIRADDRLADVYAVMLTAREDIETKLAALRLGYDDFLVKSASELEIVAKLSAARRLVSRQHRLDETVRELYGLATRDELTGLFNRRFFFSEAERLLAEGHVVNLVFFDLDDFKIVNDTYGHLAGDRILRDIGSLFLRRTRHEDLIARYGGDEFVMLVTRLAPEEVEVLTGRLAAEIASSQWGFGTDIVTLGVTTGFACSSLLDTPNVSQLLSAGDRDLYKNKWTRKHPDSDPGMYSYEREREGRVVEMGDSTEQRREKKHE